jgi:hypothetical protein
MSSSDDFCFVDEIIQNDTHGSFEPDLTLRLVFKEAVDDGRITYLAPAPADHRASFSGSGLPFANPSQAFDDTPNKGTAQLDGNAVTLHLYTPNAYHNDFSRKVVDPHVNVMYLSGGKKRDITIHLGHGIPYRSAHYPVERQDATFYYSDLPARSQEAILLASGYPETNERPKTFWGLRPPHP